MNRYISQVVYLGAMGMMALLAGLGVYLLLDQQFLAEMTRQYSGLPVLWHTVDSWQWYSLGVLTGVYLGIGVAGLYFLGRAFRRFAGGEFFSLANSLDLRRFAALLFAYGIAKPLHFTLCGLLLSANHPAGQKMLSVSLGSSEIMLVGAALIFWVVSNLLVHGCQLQAENRLFV